jgi:hypothetical protein
MTRSRLLSRPSRLVAGALLTACSALALTLPAAAAWSSAGGGTAAGSATVMPTGTAPSGGAAGDAVTISWAAADMSNGTAVQGYVIHRYNASTGAMAVVGPSCSGVVTSTTCTESSVPPGQWVYTDTPVQDSWTGGQSPQSSPITVP